MTYEEFTAERAKLEEKRLEAEALLQQAQTTHEVVKTRHEGLEVETYNAPTEQDRSALQAKLAESAEQLKQASQQVVDREKGLATATGELEAFNTLGNKVAALRDSAIALGDSAAGAAATVVAEGAKLAPDAFAAIGSAFAFRAQTEYGIPADVKQAEALLKGELFKELKDAAPDGFRTTLGVATDHAERQNIEEGIKQHEQHVQEMEELENEFVSGVKAQKQEDREMDIELADQKHSIQISFEVAAERANKMFARQDANMQEVYGSNLAQDPHVRTAQVALGGTMQEELNVQRYEMTRELCRPLAESNVQEQHALELAENVAKNQELLEKNATRLAGQWNAEVRQETYSDMLQRNQQEKEKTLQARFPQDVEREIGSLQQEHFPQVHALGVEPPGLEQSGLSYERALTRGGSEGRPV